MESLTPVFMLSAALFAIGILAAVLRRSLITVLIGIELMLGAGNLLLVAFDAHWATAGGGREILLGQVLAFFVIAASGAQIAIGLGVLLALYRDRNSLNIDEVNLLRW